MKKRIPTLFALTLIIISMVLAGVLFYLENQRKTVLTPLYNPQNIKIVNVEDSSLSITWQTKEPGTGEIIYGTSPLLLNQKAGDDRDSGQEIPQNHLTHFVTLKKLAPNTSYFYKIKSDSFAFPESQALEFKTGPQIDSPSNSKSPSLRGTILENNSPVDEALVLLKIPGAQEIATVTLTAGNFLLPVSTLREANFSNYFSLPPKQAATLEVTRGNQKSIVNLSLPLNKALPPIILGQDFTIEESVAQASESATLTRNINYDLNRDGKVNAIDLLTVIESAVNNPTDKLVDFNGDSKVDQIDIDLIEAEIDE